MNGIMVTVVEINMLCHLNQVNDQRAGKIPIAAKLPGPKQKDRRGQQQIGPRT